MFYGGVAEAVDAVALEATAYGVWVRVPPPLPKERKTNMPTVKTMTPKEWLDLLLEHKNNANITFNLSNNDTRILLTYIEILQQENARLKDKIEKIEEWLKYKAEALDTFDIPKRKETGAFWFTTRGEIDGLLELLKEN